MSNKDTIFKEESTSNVNWHNYDENNDNLNWEKLLFCIEKLDDQNVRDYFDAMEIRIVTIYDEKGFTLLHHSINKSWFDRVKFILSYAKEIQKESPSTI